MNLATWIAVIVLALIVFLVIRYLIREKRKGNKCIGCPYAGECMKYSQCDKESIESIIKEIKITKDNAKDNG